MSFDPSKIDSRLLNESQCSWPSLPKPGGMTMDMGEVFDLNSSTLFQEELNKMDQLFEFQEMINQNMTAFDKNKERMMCLKQETEEMETNKNHQLEKECDHLQKSIEKKPQGFKDAEDEKRRVLGKINEMLGSEEEYRSKGRMSPLDKREVLVGCIDYLGMEFETSRSRAGAQSQMEPEERESVPIDQVNRLLFDDAYNFTGAKSREPKPEKEKMKENQIKELDVPEPSNTSREFCRLQSSIKSTFEQCQEMDEFTTSFKALRNSRELEFFSSPFLVSSAPNDINEAEMGKVQKKKKKLTQRKHKSKKDRNKKTKHHKKENQKENHAQPETIRIPLLRENEVEESETSSKKTDTKREETEGCDPNILAFSTEKESSQEQKPTSENTLFEIRSSQSNTTKFKNQRRPESAEEKEMVSDLPNKDNQKICTATDSSNNSFQEEGVFKKEKKDHDPLRISQNHFEEKQPVYSSSKAFTEESRREITKEKVSPDKKTCKKSRGNESQSDSEILKREIDMLKNENEMLRKTNKSQANKLELYLQTFRELKIQTVDLLFGF